MHRIDGPAAAPGGVFTEGDPAVGTPATVVTDDWLNAVQEEIAAVIEGGGVALSKPSNDQLLLAVKALADAAVPVGTVVTGYFVGDRPGYLYCGGGLVSRAAYPRLWAMVSAAGLVVTEATWPTDSWTLFGQGDGATTFRLPDLRGVSVRLADNGRGIDVGRELGSHQMDAIQNITGSFGASSSDATNLADGTGAFQHDGPTSAQWGADPKAPEAGFTFDASRVVRTAGETRVRSVALGAVVKY